MLANRLIDRKNTILHHQMVKKDCPILYFFCFRLIKNDIFTQT